MKRPALLAAGGLLLALAGNGAAPASERPARGGPRLDDLGITSGRPFSGDRRLLATVSPNGDGLRDRAVVRFRLEHRARVVLRVIVCGKHPRAIRTIGASLGRGRHSLVWAPRPRLPARTYLLRLKVTAPNGARRAYGSLDHRLARKQPAPVVRVLGVTAGFTKRSYAPGALAYLRIATDEPAFTLQLFQAGPETEPTTGDGMEGIPVGDPQQVDWSANRDGPATISVRLGAWPNGMYFARLTTPGGALDRSPELPCCRAAWLPPGLARSVYSLSG